MADSQLDRDIDVLADAVGVVARRARGRTGMWVLLLDSLQERLDVLLAENARAKTKP